MDDDELRVLRTRIAAAEQRLGRRQMGVALRTPRMVGQVFAQVTLPTTPGVFYACHPVTFKAGSTEGAPGVQTVDTTSTVLIRVIGQAPALGDLVVGCAVPYRWEAQLGQPTAVNTITITIMMCARRCPLPGVAVTIHSGSGTGPIVATGTTDSSGQFGCSPTVGTYYATFALVNYTLPGTTTVVSGGTPNSYTLDAGPNFLHLSSSVYGPQPDVPVVPGSLVEFHGGGTVTAGGVLGPDPANCFRPAAGGTGSGTVGYNVLFNCGSLNTANTQNYCLNLRDATGGWHSGLAFSTWTPGVGPGLGFQGGVPACSSTLGTSVQCNAVLTVPPCFPKAVTLTAPPPSYNDPPANTSQGNIALNMGTLTFSLP